MSDAIPEPPPSSNVWIWGGLAVLVSSGAGLRAWAEWQDAMAHFPL